MTRNLSLSPRKENQRDLQPVLVPTQFTLQEIKKHFDESIESIKEQYEVADLLAYNGNVTGCKTIWRSQVVMVEGLLDFYIHEISKYCLFRMFTGEWNKSEKYSNFLVPMNLVEEAIAVDESKDWFFTYLNNRFSRDVYLSKESMKDQLNLIGIHFNYVMEEAFPSENQNESIKIGSKIITDLFKRRNQIAHQNDRSHASAKQEDISKEYVTYYFGCIEKIVNAIQKIAEKIDANTVNVFTS